MPRRPARPDPYAPNDNGILYRCVGPVGLGSRPVRAKSPAEALTTIALVWACPRLADMQAWDHAAQDWRAVR